MADCLIIISCLIACAGLVSTLICGTAGREKAMFVSSTVTLFAVGAMIAIGILGG